MRAIGYFGIILVIVGVIALVFGATIIVGKEKENTFHWVAVGLGLILAVIGLIMVIVGGSRATLKGYSWISVPSNMAKNITASINSYLKGGPTPCFINAPDTGPGLWSRFKSAVGSGYNSVKSGVSSAYTRVRNRNGKTEVVAETPQGEVVVA